MKIQNVIREINELAKQFDELKFMEVCGTHTQTIAREFKFFMVGKISLN